MLCHQARSLNRYRYHKLHSREPVQEDSAHILQSGSRFTVRRWPFAVPQAHSAGFGVWRSLGAADGVTRPSPSPCAHFKTLCSLRLCGESRFPVWGSEFCLLPSVFCLLPSAFCLLPSVFCLLPSAFCLLSSVRSLATPGYRFRSIDLPQPVPSCQLHRNRDRASFPKYANPLRSHL